MSKTVDTVELGKSGECDMCICMCGCVARVTGPNWICRYRHCFVSVALINDSIRLCSTWHASIDNIATTTLPTRWCEFCNHFGDGQ